MIENNIKLILAPISYDYMDGEIIYRIIVNDQLITERSIPVLNLNQALSENIILGEPESKKYLLRIKNLKDKKVFLSKIIINNISIEYSPDYDGGDFTLKNCKIVLRIE